MAAVVGRPVPSEKQVSERVVSGQSGILCLITDQAAQFIAIRQSPVGISAIMLSVQGGNMVEGLQPGAGELADVGINRPRQPGQMVDGHRAVGLEANEWPWCSVLQLAIVTAPLTSNLRSGCIIAAGLAGVQHMTHDGPLSWKPDRLDQRRYMASICLLTG